MSSASGLWKGSAVTAPYPVNRVSGSCAPFSAKPPNRQSVARSCGFLFVKAESIRLCRALTPGTCTVIRVSPGSGRGPSTFLSDVAVRRNRVGVSAEKSSRWIWGLVPQMARAERGLSTRSVKLSA